MGSPRALGALLASLLVATPASAQPKGSAPAPQQAAADLVKQAIAKSQSGDHLTAIDLYLQAYALVPQHTLLSNVGSEYQQAGKPAEALKYFCMYLEKDPSGTNASYATRKAMALQTELGNAAVDEATVCQPVAPADPESAAADGARPASGDVADHPGRTLRYVGLGVGVAGVAAIGVGVFFGVKAKRVSDDITNHPVDEAWQDDIAKLERDGQRYEDRQIQMMIAGGVLVAAGAILYVVGRRRGNRVTESVSVRPVVARDAVGLALGGGF